MMSRSRLASGEAAPFDELYLANANRVLPRQARVAELAAGAAASTAGPYFQMPVIGAAVAEAPR